MRCPYCAYKWSYRGASKYYVTCPKCHYKIFVGKRAKGQFI